MMRFHRGNLEQELAKYNATSDATYAGELNQLTLYRLIATFEKVMSRFEGNQNKVTHTIIQYPFSIDSQKDYINKTLMKKPQVNFIELFEECTSKLHAVFTFLALLDLIQNRTLLIFMGEGFNNFVVSTLEAAPEVTAPREEDAN
jgi:segregation and condensation protein A